MKDFIEMVNVRIENGDSLTIGRAYGEYYDLDSIVPDSIVADSKICIKTETGGYIIIPEGFELYYDAQNIHGKTFLFTLDQDNKLFKLNDNKMNEMKILMEVI